jgi:hypothetical protein
MGWVEKDSEGNVTVHAPAATTRGPKPAKAYLDNCLVGGLVQDDLDPAESRQVALHGPGERLPERAEHVMATPGWKLLAPVLELDRSARPGDVLRMRFGRASTGRAACVPCHGRRFGRPLKAGVGPRCPRWRRRSRWRGLPCEGLPPSRKRSPGPNLVACNEPLTTPRRRRRLHRFSLPTRSTRR